MNRSGVSPVPMMNLLIAIQVATFALVFHLWMDRMGSFEAGGQVTGILIVASLLVLLAPSIEIAVKTIDEACSWSAFSLPDLCDKHRRGDSDMNLDDVGDFVWFAILIGIWEMTMGPVYLLRGDTSGTVQTALWFAGTLGWVGAIYVLIRGGVL